VVDEVSVSLRLWDTFGDHHKDRRFAYGRSVTQEGTGFKLMVLRVFMALWVANKPCHRTLALIHTRNSCPTIPLLRSIFHWFYWDISPLLAVVCFALPSFDYCPNPPSWEGNVL